MLLFSYKLPTQSYLTNRIGHEIGTENVLNFDYVIWVETMFKCEDSTVKWQI